MTFPNLERGWKGWAIVTPSLRDELLQILVALPVPGRTPGGSAKRLKKATRIPALHSGANRTGALLDHEVENRQNDESEKRC